jgi:hypothetical protein
MDFIGYHSKKSTKPGKNIRISLDITAKIAPILKKLEGFHRISQQK